METTIIIAHYMSLMIYVANIVWATKTILLVSNFSPIKRLTNVVLLMLVCSIIQALSFIWLQLDWILQNRNESVGETVSLMWLFFDYINGLVILFYILTVYGFIKHRKNSKVTNKELMDSMTRVGNLLSDSTHSKKTMIRQKGDKVVDIFHVLYTPKH